ncbi:MAG: hypothetical protein ABIJ86_15935 [Spirochaetota bacterium]
MRYSKCLGIMTLVVCFGLLGPAVLVAQEAKPVYLVRQIGQNDVWTMNMGIQTEALRLYVPTAFERKGKAINLSFDTPKVSLISGRETVISRSGDGILVRYDVVIAGAPPLPKADRSMTIRFSLAELGAADVVDSGTPGSHAVRLAILTGPYAKGHAWVQSIDFIDNRFIVVVGLKR